MSIESTQDQPVTQAVKDPYGDTPRSRPSGERSSHAPTLDNGDGAKRTPLPGTAEGAATGDVPSQDLPVHPTKNLPSWLLFNIAVPTLMLAAAGLLVWYLGSVESPARPPIDDTPVGRLFALPAVDVVQVHSLASTGEKLHLSADGTVVPFREAVLATEVAGRIVEKSPLCEAGKYVTKGHVLMKIDPTDYELEVKRLQRQQQQAYESLGEADQEIVNTNRSMELARADIALQQREVKRRESLPKQYASQNELDVARRAVLTAEQQLVVFQNQLELAKKKRTRLESSEQLAALQLEAAKINLQRTEIIAPMDGVIVSEQAEINTFVARGNPVVTIEDTSKVEVAAKLRVDQLYWILNQKGVQRSRRSDEGAKSRQDRGYQLPPTSVSVRYVVSGRDGLVYQWKGKLNGYDGIGLDEQTRTVPVRIVVDDPQAFEVLRNGKVLHSSDQSTDVAGPTTLVRGMFVSLRLELDPAVELIVLPSEALKPGNRVWQFVADPSVLEKSLIAVEEENDGNDPPPSADAETAVVDPSTTNHTSPLADELDPMAAFHPDAWVAGQLNVLHGVRPVDQYVTTAEFSAGEAVAVGDEEEPEVDKAWICEIGDAGLRDGSFVVISPMGSIRTDAFPVRAPAEAVGTTNKRPPAATAAESTKVFGRRPTEPLPVPSAIGMGLSKTASPEGDTDGNGYPPPACGGFVGQSVGWLTPPAIHGSASGLASLPRWEISQK